MSHLRLWLTLPVWAVAQAAYGSQVSLPLQPATPGSSVVFVMTFAPQSAPASSLQFDLQYDASAMSLTATIGDAARNSGKSLYSADGDPNVKRFLVAGLNQNLIPAGTLLTLFVNLNQNAATGAYPLKFSNLLAADIQGNPVFISGSDGAVTVQPGVPAPLQMAGVLNSASLLSGPVAPGELITLIGSGIGPATEQLLDGLPSSVNLAGVTAQFDGSLAPLIYGAPNQLNAIVPYEVAGGRTTQLEVRNGTQTIAAATLSVAATVPAIFTVDASGVGQAVILNDDGSLNSPSNPASRGSVVTLFATGAGQTNPAGQDGILVFDLFNTPLAPVSAQIGGLNSEIVYAGAVPGGVQGLLAVKCTVPADLAPTGQAPVILTIGAVSSPQAVTLAVQ